MVVVVVRSQEVCDRDARLITLVARVFGFVGIFIKHTETRPGAINGASRIGATINVWLVAHCQSLLNKGVMYVTCRGVL